MVIVKIPSSLSSTRMCFDDLISLVDMNNVSLTWLMF